MASPPTAFVSYSWDDDAHKEWVLDLASRLVENGVTVKLDRWDVPPGQSLTKFMEASVHGCDFTLVICTPNYAARSLARTGGVGYEQQIISGQIAAGIDRSKFIPIIRRGSFDAQASDCALPAHFLGTYALDFRDSVNDETFEDLLRAIFKVPRLTAPALGRTPVFASQGQKTVRLATTEIDGWHLHSGVVNNELYPETYHIPSEAERQSAKITDLVKLTFEFSPGDDADGDEFPSIERMWVEIVGSNGPYYVGRLRNQPSCFVYVNPDDEKEFFVDEDAQLTFDSEVVFLPEHIISIMDQEEAEEGRKILDLNEPPE